MVGIKSYGAHIPRFRLDRNIMQMALLFLGFAPLRGEKAVANWDEDSITMAVAAAKDCLNGEDLGKVDGLYFASTSQTYALRQNAGIVAAALDIKTDSRTADFTDSTKSGTGALLAAADAIAAGSLNSCLVCAADLRVSKVGSNGDYTYGDGAALSASIGTTTASGKKVIGILSSYSYRCTPFYDSTLAPVNLWTRGTTTTPPDWTPPVPAQGGKPLITVDYLAPVFKTRRALKDRAIASDSFDNAPVVNGVTPVPMVRQPHGSGHSVVYGDGHGNGDGGMDA